MAAACTPRLQAIAAWPQETLHLKRDGAVHGFLMPKIVNHHDIHYLCGPKTRLQRYPYASYRFLVAVAANVARAFAVVHDHGHVIGDVNETGVHVSKHARISLVDCDSFQVSVGAHTFKCDVGSPLYQPPKMQSIGSYRGVARTQNHDRFGLAVLLFQTLFFARHPFAGAYTGSDDMPIERAIREFRFAYAADAAQRKMRLPLGSLGLGSVTKALAVLFERAFLESGPHGRPTALEWASSLDEYAAGLIDCEQNAGHAHRRDLGQCPLCAIEARSGVMLFVPPPSSQSARASVPLDELWAELLGYFREARIPTRDELAPGLRVLELPPSPVPARVAAINQKELLEGQAGLLAYAQEALDRLPAERAAGEARRKATTTASVVILIASIVGAFVVSPYLLCVVALLPALAQRYRSSRPLPEPVLRATVEEKRRLVDELRSASEDAERTAARVERLIAAVASAQTRLVSLFDEVSRESASVTVRDLAQLEHRAKQLHGTLSAFDAQRVQELRRFEAQRHERQLERYLDRFEVKDSRVRGIGPSLCANLLSYGIETASDISRARLEHVPGFGDKRIEALLEWRADLTRGFKLNPVDPLDARDLARREAQLAAERARKIGELRQVLEQVKAASLPLRARLKDVRSRALQLTSELESAQQAARIYRALNF